MSISEAFIILIEEQPELFTPQDRKDLEQQAVNWSEDEEQLKNEISNWIKPRKHICDSTRKIYQKLPKQEGLRLPGDGKSAPKIKPEDYKQTLLNAIHRNLSDFTQAATPSQTSS